jgi:hypothetical protein
MLSCRCRKHIPESISINIASPPLAVVANSPQPTVSVCAWINFQPGHTSKGQSSSNIFPS